MKKWECPECGEGNSHQMILCPCGYRDEPMVDVEPYPAPVASQQQTFETPSHLTIDREQPRGGEAEFGQTHKKKSDSPTDWRHSYSRWMIVAILIVFVLRKTTDGLWFIAFVAYAIAKRFEERKKNGTPLIIGKKKNESIWQYGVGRTLTALSSPAFLKKIPYYSKGLFDIPRFASRIVGTMCALHLYIGVVGLIDTINPECIAELLTIINKPFFHLLTQWPAYQACAEEFISHGYTYRLPFLNHVYIVCTFAALLFVWFAILELCDGDLEGRYDRGRIHLNSMSLPGTNTILDKCFDSILKYYPTRLVIFGLCSWGLFYFFKYAPRLLLHFPGEALPRHGKYAWLASKAYTDNIGFFTPIYLLLPIVLLFCGSILIGFEPFY